MPSIGWLLSEQACGLLASLCVEPTTGLCVGTRGRRLDLSCDGSPVKYTGGPYVLDRSAAPGDPKAARSAKEQGICDFPSFFGATSPLTLCMQGSLLHVCQVIGHLHPRPLHCRARLHLPPGDQE
jgi:hypothetical protein